MRLSFKINNKNKKLRPQNENFIQFRYMAGDLLFFE